MIDRLLGKSVAVLGLGKSGMSVVRELRRRGVHIIAWDDKENLRLEALRLGAEVRNLEGLEWGGVEFLVLSPSISHKNPIYREAEASGARIISDIELFVASNTKSHYIGITGTNGKSTTAALITHILKSAGMTAEIGGNFGVAVFDLPALGADGWYVLELSSYQLELVPSLDLDIAAFSNVTPDHMDHHGSMQEYVKAKTNIFKRARKRRYTNVVAVDDEYTKKIFAGLKKDPRATNIPVSFDHRVAGVWANKDGILMDEGREVMDLSSLGNLRGRHNWQNIALAFAAARAAGVAEKKIAHAVGTFKTLEHRLEKVGELSGVEFVNDSKATNAESAGWALGAYDEIYWIIGGRKKEGGIGALAPKLKEGMVRAALAIGECEKEFYAATKNLVDSYKCGRLEKAVRKAHKLALRDLKKGRVKKPVILLSPAAASFDQYSCFEERGRHFAKIFREMKGDA